MRVDFSKIKLVIWDLDETFWEGVLSDNTAQFNESNAQLVRDMTDAGVINAICSKNDENQVIEYLKVHDIAEYFVFNSINWTPKGARVSQIIREMNLRAPNVLFIDDNPTNLGEAKDACPELMIADETVIPALRAHFSEVPKKDRDHKRLKQYKVLQEKQNFRATTQSNDDFLRKCNIQVQIRHDCAEHLERIEDLVQRSNQLNFTKVRSSSDELMATIQDENTQTGYVSVQDKFGDYGIVGFYALKDQVLEHFVFSCRTLNMGVEQYVYAQLGRPKVTVVGEVSSSLELPCPDWINRAQTEDAEEKFSLEGKKLLLKGPCDLQQMFSFIRETPNIITEFAYVNNRGVLIESGCHTTHIVESFRLPAHEQKRLEKALPFSDHGMFRTRMFDEDVGVVVLSMFMDPNLGLYQEKATGAIVAFGEFTNDLTDESIWESVLSGSVFTANCRFKKSDLEKIRRDYRFLGRIEPDAVIENLEAIYQRLEKSTRLVLCLGSEMPYEKNTQPAYENRHEYHRILNQKIREWASGYDRVLLLDVNQYLAGQEDFTNNINHFQKRIYFQMCEALMDIFNSGGQVLEFATEQEKRREDLLRKVKKLPNKVLRLMNRLKS